MQFHLNGFRAGDPRVHEPVGEPASSDSLPEEVDVLIVGCGPAGLTLATQLSPFPEIKTRIIERSNGPLRLGPAGAGWAAPGAAAVPLAGDQGSHYRTGEWPPEAWPGGWRGGPHDGDVRGL